MKEDFLGLDPELRKAFEKMRYDLQSVQKEAKTILRSLGIRLKEVRKYSADSRNFTPDDWKVLLAQRREAKEFQEEMKKALGVDVEGEKKKKAEEKAKKKAKKKKKEEREEKKRKKKIAKKTENKKTAKRRKKLVGSKKRWLQM